MTENEIAELQELIESRRWRDVDRIVEPLARRRLVGSLFPAFLPLLTVKDYVIYKYAITVVGKKQGTASSAGVCSQRITKRLRPAASWGRDL